MWHCFPNNHKRHNGTVKDRNGHSINREFKIPVPAVTGTAKCNNDVISSQVELEA